MSTESDSLLPKEKELTNEEKQEGYKLYSLARDKLKIDEFKVLFNTVKDNPNILNYTGIAGQGRWAENTPLWAAVEVGNTEALRLLANAKGIEIDKLPKNHYGNRGTPLYRAVLIGDVESVEILLAAGANFDYKRDKKTPIEIAIEKTAEMRKEALSEKQKAYQDIAGLLTAAASKNGGKRKRKKSIRKRKNMKRKVSRKR